MKYGHYLSLVKYIVSKAFKFIFIFYCLFLGLVSNLWAENKSGDSLRTFVIENQITMSTSVGKMVSVYPVLPSHRIDKSEIITIPDSLFYRFGQWGEMPEHEWAWVKFKVHNKTNEKFQGAILFGLEMDSIIVYSKYSDSLTYLATTGGVLPISKRIYPTRTSQIILFLESGQKIEIYAQVKLSKNSTNEYYYHFYLRDNFFTVIRTDMYNKVFWAIAMGFLMVFPVLSLIMYLNFKKNYFIYYSILIFFIGMYFLGSNGIIWMFIHYPLTYREFMLSGVPTAGMIASSFFFFDSYIGIKKRIPLFYKVLLSFTLLSVLITISHFWIIKNSNIGFDIANSFSVVYMMLLIICLIYFHFKKIKEAKILLIATSLILVGGVLFTLTLLRIIPRNVIFSNGFQWGAIAFSGTLLYGLFDNIKQIQSERFKLKVEKEKTDELLFNILPYEVAMELKEKGVYEARDFDNVSVLFSDFKNFTLKSAQITAKELVDEINICFIEFDRIMEKYGIEKIKTIGDSYMAAAGLSPMSEKRAEVVVWAAIEMQEFLVHRNQESKEVGKETFEMRVGIHSGPVIAGIVGIKKFQYDIWGDTVNTASRVEAHGQEEKVNISESTYREIKDHPYFIFEEREPIEVRGKGLLKMYFVEKRQ